MHAESFVNNWLESKCGWMHRARARVLASVVGALLRGGKLSLTHLGRGLSGSSYEKHRIKRVDRLLGNAHLHRERVAVYRALAHELLRGMSRVVLVVDWSDGHPGRGWMLLRASLAFEGRGITVYEEAHPLCGYGNRRVQEEFLTTLHTVIPVHCCPIVVTDAGFQGPWFRQVEAQGWHWLGRIRGRAYCRRQPEARWTRVSTLSRRATRQVQSFCDSVLYQNRPLRCALYLVKTYSRARGRPARRRGLGALARYSRRKASEPWLLAASPTLREMDAGRIVALYAKRMSIEESFRDLKSHRWGFAARYARSHSMQRLQVLLLVSTLATFALWLAGLVAQAKQWQRRFQANTERRRRVLSTVFLGWRVLQVKRMRMQLASWRFAREQLRLLIHQQGATE